MPGLRCHLFYLRISKLLEEDACLKYLDGADILAETGVHPAFAANGTSCGCLEDLFAGECPSDRKTHFVGGMCMGRAVSAAGGSFAQALGRVTGEAAEICALSCARDGDSGSPPRHDWSRFIRCGTVDRWVRTCFSAGEVPIDVVPLSATRLDWRWLPPANEGCGAAPDFEDAWRHGALELIERDALALWWYGGRRARRLRALEKVLSSDKGGEILADVSTVAGIPVVVAMSFDAEGRMFTFGSAAEVTVDAAARKAILELHQMMTGHYLIRQKLRRLGQSALQPKDIEAIKLATRVRRDDVLAEAVSSDPVDDHPAAETVGHTAIDLRERIGREGLRLACVDLGTHNGLRVAKVVSPDLQPSTSCVETGRLRQARELSSGGFRCLRGVSLC